MKFRRVELRSLDFSIAILERKNFHDSIFDMLLRLTRISRRDRRKIIILSESNG